MTVAELVLRLGCSLVAWLVLLTHCVWLAALPELGCTADAALARRVLLLFTPITLLFCAGVRLGFTVPGIGSALRLPALLLAPLLLLGAWRTAREWLTGLGAQQALCEISVQTPAWWPIVQLTTLLVIGVSASHAWRQGAR
jgi:hypothetical protein